MTLSPLVNLAGNNYDLLITFSHMATALDLINDVLKEIDIRQLTHLEDICKSNHTNRSQRKWLLKKSYTSLFLLLFRFPMT